MMLFCPKCGSIMMPSKSKKGAFACSCGFVKKEIANSKIKETLVEQAEIPIVHKDIDPSPLVKAECPKCGNSEARFWTAQTRASDEPETKFYKCEKCKHTWRDYS